MRFALTPKEKRVLSKASRLSIQNDLKHLKSFLNDGRWLGKNNRYQRNTIIKIKEDKKCSLTKVKQRHLSQYIAASTILHCADGWSFLGRAISSHATCDRDTSRHLAYYAELRAAMSLLATEGIGIFDNTHFIIDSRGTCQALGHATHKIAWLALEYSARCQTSATLFAHIIKPNGIPLAEWLDKFYSGASWNAIAFEWLKNWGLDLHYLSKDQTARNESSYRPTRLNDVPSVDVRESARYINNLWQLCEPVGNTTFSTLDRQLLRLSLEEGFKATTGRAPRDDIAEYSKRIKHLLSLMGFKGSYQKYWLNYLSRTIDPEDFILDLAKGKSSVYDPRHHLQVISRAFLLLRVATGTCSQLLRDVDFKKNDLEFWWNPLGQERGLWDVHTVPDDLDELWTDARESIEEIQKWTDTNAANNVSYAGWHNDCSYAISELEKCERVALLGLRL